MAKYIFTERNGCLLYTSKRQRNEATNLENDLFTTLEIVNEMLERGFTFGQLDLYKSQATEFLIEGDTLIPPFIALEGLGENVAKPVSYTHLIAH